MSAVTPGDLGYSVPPERSELSKIAERFASLWRSLAGIGRDPVTGGADRPGWSPAELSCREWFAEEAADRELTLEADGNGNLFAWWGYSGERAVVTGSHFDSVPQGGAYDGPLGIVSALLAVDLLRERGLRPVRPIVIAAFAEEEGSRFGLACLGSRLLTGAVAAHQALALRDRDGMTLAQAIADAGGDPAEVGPDPALLTRFGAFVELHIEQGRALADLDAPVAVATGIWPHGRWRLDFTGEANHAGTTRMADRRDPMRTFAATALDAPAQAERLGAHATFGRVAVEPNATNAIPARVTAWLDARAAQQSTLDELVAAVTGQAGRCAQADGTSVLVSAESVTPEVVFDPALRDRMAAALAAEPDLPDETPLLPTGAGHDAGALAGTLPTGMLFVRNPTGVSHAPAEHATDADCAAGVVALAAVLAELACR